MYKLGKSGYYDRINNTFTVDNVVLSAEQAEVIAGLWADRNWIPNESNVEKMQPWSGDVPTHDIPPLITEG